MSLHIQTKTKKTGLVLTIQSKRIFVSPKSRGGCLVECAPIIRSNLAEMGGLLVDIPDSEMAPNDSCLLIFMPSIMTLDMNSADICKQYNIVEMTVWFLILGHKKHCGFYLIPTWITLLGGSQSPCQKDAQ